MLPPSCALAIPRLPVPRCVPGSFVLTLLKTLGEFHISSYMSLNEIDALSLTGYESPPETNAPKVSLFLLSLAETADHLDCGRADGIDESLVSTEAGVIVDRFCSGAERAHEAIREDVLAAQLRASMHVEFLHLHVRRASDGWIGDDVASCPLLSITIFVARASTDLSSNSRNANSSLFSSRVFRSAAHFFRRPLAIGPAPAR